MSNPPILGIDPGIARVGYGVVVQDRGHLHLRAYGTIETSQRLPQAERLRQIHNSILKLIADFRPRRVAVEKLYHSKNVKTALSVGEARGVILLAATEENVPVAEFSPQEVKLAVTGYGKAEKGQVQRMLRLLFHLEQPPSPDDAADAIALAVCGTSRGKYE